MGELDVERKELVKAVDGALQEIGQGAAEMRVRRVRDVAAAELIGRELLACAERALTAPAGAAWPGPPASAARSR